MKITYTRSKSEKGYTVYTASNGWTIVRRPFFRHIGNKNPSFIFSDVYDEDGEIYANGMLSLAEAKQVVQLAEDRRAAQLEEALETVSLELDYIKNISEYHAKIEKFPRDIIQELDNELRVMNEAMNTALELSVKNCDTEKLKTAIESFNLAQTIASETHALCETYIKE